MGQRGGFVIFLLYLFDRNDAKIVYSIVRSLGDVAVKEAKTFG
jgi:hypothetical protein